MCTGCHRCSGIGVIGGRNRASRPVSGELTPLQVTKSNGPRLCLALRDEAKDERAQSIDRCRQEEHRIPLGLGPAGLDQVSGKNGTYDAGQGGERVRDGHENVGVAGANVQVIHAEGTPGHATEADRHSRAEYDRTRARAQRGQSHEHELQEHARAAEELAHVRERPALVDHEQVGQVA